MAGELTDIVAVTRLADSVLPLTNSFYGRTFDKTHVEQFLEEAVCRVRAGECDYSMTGGLLVARNPYSDDVEVYAQLGSL